MKTVVVSSKAQHELEVELADILGLRLAVVVSVGPGKWMIGFMPVSSFTDYSSKGAA